MQQRLLAAAQSERSAALETRFLTPSNDITGMICQATHVEALNNQLTETV
jgi:hypothetical protein